MWFLGQLSPGAVSYNVYEAELNYFGVVPAGAAYGFIGNTNGISFADSNIGPNFSQTPPITQNPFQGAGVQSYSVTANGIYTTVPSVVVARTTSWWEPSHGRCKPWCYIENNSKHWRWLCFKSNMHKLPH